MNIKNRISPIKIQETEPFQNDKLNRCHIGKILRDIVLFYGKDGCVMSLNGEWGSGKTTFVNMWQQQLKNEGFNTLYFNAWTSDYLADPLMALVAELSELPSNKNQKIKKISQNACRLLLSATNVFVKNFLGIDYKDIESIFSKGSDIGEEYLKELANKEFTTKEFKQDVKEFVQENAKRYPIVFIVDELDRCNPHYAVAVLERIKHLFDIPNIIFVLAINKKELGHAIQGYYGSANINADEYLRRFIDIEYTLPQPNMEAYCDYLYDEYRFSDFFENRDRKIYFPTERESTSFKNMASCISNVIQPNLRQMERIYAYTRLALMQFSPSSYLSPDVFFLVCFWKVINPIFYDQIKNKEFTPQELVTKIEEIFPPSLLRTDKAHDKNRNIYFAIAHLIFYYDNMISNKRASHNLLQPVINKETGEPDYQFETRYLDKELLNRALSFNTYKDSYDLAHIFNKIDLLESFQV